MATAIFRLFFASATAVLAVDEHPHNSGKLPQVSARFSASSEKLELARRLAVVGRRGRVRLRCRGCDGCPLAAGPAPLRRPVQPLPAARRCRQSQHIRPRRPNEQHEPLSYTCTAEIAVMPPPAAGDMSGRPGASHDRCRRVRWPVDRRDCLELWNHLSQGNFEHEHAAEKRSRTPAITIR